MFRRQLNFEDISRSSKVDISADKKRDPGQADMSASVVKLDGIDYSGYKGRGRYAQAVLK